MADANLGMKILVGHDNVTLAKKQQSLAQGVPVFVNPVIQRDTMGASGLGEKILVGPDNVSYAAKKRDAAAKPIQLAQNPVENPPMNNWSVNQPSPPHAQGLAGKADLGQNIIVDGHHVAFAQKLAQKSAMGLY